MPQPLNINTIKTFLIKNPPVIGNKFQILIERGSESAPENITMTCSNINLPGQTFSTNPGGNPGPEVKYPYQVAYEDAVISFLTTGNLDQRIPDNFVPIFLQIKDQIFTLIKVNEYQ